MSKSIKEERDNHEKGQKKDLKFESSIWKPSQINCPTCNKKISFNAMTCPNCGEPITGKLRTKEITKRKFHSIIWAIVAVIGFIFIIIIKNIPADLSDKDENVIKREFPKLSADVQKELIDDIKSFLTTLEDKKDVIPSFKMTDNKDIDKILSRVNRRISYANEKCLEKKRRAEQEIAQLEREEKALSELTNAMTYTPRGSEYLERLNRVREKIDDWRYKYPYEPFYELDDFRDKFQAIQKSISLETQIDKTISNSETHNHHLNTEKQTFTETELPLEKKEL